MSKLEAEKESGKLNLDFLKRKNKKKQESPRDPAIQKAKDADKKHIQEEKKRAQAIEKQKLNNAWDGIQSPSVRNSLNVNIILAKIT